MGHDVAFARDIRPLFSDRDVGSKSSRFDLSSYNEVRTNAELISSRRRHHAVLRPMAGRRRRALPQS
jgi:hypothetical protein